MRHRGRAGGDDVPWQHRDRRAVPADLGWREQADETGLIAVFPTGLRYRVLERTGLTELSLNPVEILGDPVIDRFLDAHLVTLGLGADRFGALALEHSTSLLWPARSSVFRFGMLDGVTHQYANGRNNPAGFALASEFWEFFAAHRLP
jgi:hypothetical protein